jgi:pyruvate dehydrogenase E1 component alpha subunit
MSFFGDAATEEGAFHEALNFATLKRVPVVFVCENNLYSVLTPLGERQPDRPLTDLALAHGLPAAEGDGNDPVEVLLLARDAVDRARSGDGPTLLVLHTYRFLEHVGPYGDDDLGYRPPGELDAWRERDPLATFERALLADGVLTAGEPDERRREIAAEIDDAVAFARESPFPAAEVVAANVYATQIRP